MTAPNLPPFATFPVLTTPRLLLRELTEADLPQVLPIAMYRGKQADSLEEARWMHEQIASNARTGESVHWGIFLPDGQTLVGTAGFYRGFLNAAGELGYIMKPEFRGQGLMREAAAAITRFGFEGMGLRRIFAYTDPANQPSVNVLLGVGFVEQADAAEGSRKFVLTC